ncbi:hypothetical protein GCM10020001_029850 [Nonomuraea salmonea]
MGAHCRSGRVALDRFSNINADLRKRAISAVSSESSRTNPLASFGQNEWLVDELYQKYLQDPESVDKAWWNFFADYNPDNGPGRPPGQGGGERHCDRARASQGAAEGATLGSRRG